ncbi:DUF1634 domain-containing protein [Bdellovibrio bacteriovorus]|uniref:DUF1634 domain-containing protein n=1 Tax=Bdellovibrio bacteriovorus TaxID=959 RepID=UPI0021D2D03F|nr:DUF1634 domain-containing protein [Bdellovibrio bacteriovorus]UXR63400.1 DUF1634 domain-containing protein [Bdellovibrio bacteriovorus]
MSAEPKKDSLHELELIISQILRGGVLFAGIFLLIGWLWMWFRDGDNLQTFTSYEPRPLIENIHWALVMNDRALLVSLFGLVALVCLPLIRVLMTGVLFIKQKDKGLAIMAFAVFIALVGSFLLGIDI